MRILALLALGVDLVAANSYTPPLQLHPCSATAADQQFTIESNETTVYSPIPWSPDYELGYCLDIVNNGTTEGTLVQAANCDQKGCRNPGACANQLWAVRGSTIASLQPKTPFCLGVKVPAQGSQHGQLMNCNDSSAQFRTPAAGSTGPVVHVASSLCLTVGRCAAPSPPPQATAAAGTAAPTGNASCDIYSSAGNPCVSAHSMVRALYGAYAGRLYRVIRGSDNTTKAPSKSFSFRQSDSFDASMRFNRQLSTVPRQTERKYGKLNRFLCVHRRCRTLRFCPQVAMQTPRARTRSARARTAT
jgi:hypothetical protein